VQETCKKDLKDFASWLFLFALFCFSPSVLGFTITT
jgi:hypothetical protein